ncbi:lasso peptide biosynthesis B2 protein [Actinoalloteichus caeruleus]|uniref:lasso peptide biosynthesis B2 protein n=1 Tax=Actinoalloteichus cyanogriseus TaxID=2893586 RepID=UPI003BB85EE8
MAPALIAHDLHGLIASLQAAQLSPAALIAITHHKPKEQPAFPYTAASNSPMVLTSTPVTSTHNVLGASVLAAAIRCVLLIMPFRWVIWGLRELAWTATRTANRAEVDAALAAVDAAARWLPCRMACLERSITAFVLLAVRRRGVTWHIGARSSPLALHAWLADADGPIGEPASAGSHQPLTTIGGARDRHRRPRRLDDD